MEERNIRERERNRGCKKKCGRREWKERKEKR